MFYFLGVGAVQRRTILLVSSETKHFLNRKLSGTAVCCCSCLCCVIALVCFMIPVVLLGKEFIDLQNTSYGLDS